jgi:YbbR domain-containing protein
MRVWQSLLSGLTSILLALFLAVSVWVVAVYEKAPPRTDTLPSSIPVRVLDLGTNLVLAEPIPKEARIRVRALTDDWNQLRAQDFEATVDLLGLTSGQHVVPIVVTTLQPNISVVGVEPERITVKLEELAQRKLQVRVKTLDEQSIPLGYMSRLPVVVPEQITISGPKTQVEQILEAVIEVSLKDARDTVTKQDAPILLDNSANRILGLTLSPATVKVTIAVERQGGYRDVAVRATSVGSPASGYWISSINVTPVLVTVWGEQSLIQDLPGYLDTQPIDIEGATGDVVRRVALDLPEGVVVLGEGSGPEGILVQISVQPQLGGKTVYCAVELVGVPLGLTARPSLTSVDVILSGPLPALQALQPDDVRVILNLVGLGKGTHKVTPTVELPDGLGLQVKSIVPDIVEVAIQ